MPRFGEFIQRERPGDWVDHAACREHAKRLNWYPSSGEPTHVQKAICADCEVRVDCLAYAVDNREEHGIWGGISGRDIPKVGRQVLRVLEARRRAAQPGDIGG